MHGFTTDLYPMVSMSEVSPCCADVMFLMEFHLALLLPPSVLPPPPSHFRPSVRPTPLSILPFFLIVRTFILPGIPRGLLDSSVLPLVFGPLIRPSESSFVNPPSSHLTISALFYHYDPLPNVNAFHSRSLCPLVSLHVAEARTSVDRYRAGFPSIDISVDAEQYLLYCHEHAPSELGTRPSSRAVHSWFHFFRSVHPTT
ncbi:hypothetical protein C8J57DRAFT_1523864 [Mycena rebaudengoi]|nr:hypothetical protein C8J57DRAFT_1523864 [Mycena rebaudengoi]